MVYVYDRGKGYGAKILLDSVGPSGKRITTWELRYPRMVHAELMTHRMLCLAGDAVLEFDLPARHARGGRRVYRLTIADFVGKWLHGSAPHRSRWGGTRTYDLKSRLREMRIRQVDEATGDITTSTVSDAFESGTKPVYEIAGGEYKIAGSEDHRVLTGDGWKPIKDIRVGDTLVVSTQKKPDVLKADPLRLKKIDGRWRSRWQIEQRARLSEENPRCRSCGNEDGREIHHLVPVYQDPARAFDPENVTLLCDGCHVDAHRKQGWQEGNPLYSGEVIVDSIRYRGVEPTYDLQIAGPYPNFLANKVVVHNSRNSASSRAIPNEKLIAQVVDDPATPVWWGKNQSGMQAREALSELRPERCRMCGAPDGTPAAGLSFCTHDWRSDQDIAVDAWLIGRDRAVELSRTLAACGLHKQIANRVIEPWMFITVIVTATEWDNWYTLRDHPDAQPEIAYIARMMREAWDLNVPRQMDEGDWHLPLVSGIDQVNFPYEYDIADLKWISAGRCARVSYLTHEGKRDPRADIDLAKKLASSSPGHWSPFEHVAQALPDARQSGNFYGWKQFRKEFANEHVGGPRP